MISNDLEMKQAMEQLERLHAALGALRTEIFAVNPRRFAVLAEGPRAEIQRLRNEIDEFSGARAAEDAEADVWLRLTGDTIEWPAAPSSVLTSFVDGLRKGVQAVAEVLATGQLTTRPTKELKQACDLQVVAFQSGSLRIGLKLPAVVATQQTLPLVATIQDRAKSALGDYLAVVRWVASGSPPEQLAGVIPDQHKRRLILNAVRPVAPRPRGLVESVELLDSRDPTRPLFVLDRESYKRIDAAIDSAVAEAIEAHVGDLREIDLDQKSFTLRNTEDGSEIKCRFEEELIETAKNLLDRRVRATGIRRTDGVRRADSPLQLTRLEVLEPDGDVTA